MNSKQITGVLLVSLGIGALVYLYKGYYKPKKDAEALVDKVKATRDGRKIS